ncbi:hypothetical protein E3U23_11265 [Erythrobacter litoralis]|uniref:hypothetical protein n=1 Tax=Erythrobacter litoralis TaxID=39960 RepID=UPI002434AECC|nr:hypothetical protein [Erythrobacter litoralis]MDG6079768.1 hypothetical protein [Erythrobacter litoralis]
MPHRQPPRPSVETLVDTQVEALDGLMAELRLGIRDQRHFDRLEERGAAIAAGIRAAFREGTQ